MTWYPRDEERIQAVAGPVNTNFESHCINESMARTCRKIMSLSDEYVKKPAHGAREPDERYRALFNEDTFSGVEDSGVLHGVERDKETTIVQLAISVNKQPLCAVKYSPIVTMSRSFW